MKYSFGKIVLMVLALFSFATTQAGLVEKAAKHYEEGQFTDAEKVYRTLHEDYPQSFEVNYNLGNSLYKQGKITEAILYYEKALKLKPNNEDVKHNLKLSYLRTIDKIEPQPDLFLTAWAKDLALSKSTKYWPMWSIIFVCVGFLMLIVYLFIVQPKLKRINFFGGLGFIAVGLIYLCIGIYQNSLLNDNETAIVFTPTLNVKGGPSESATKLFVVHEGTKVVIKSTQDEWVEIKLMNGNVGWVKQENLQNI